MSDRIVNFWLWLYTLVTGRPHEVIYGYDFEAGERRAYLRRWHLIPNNRWLNIYLHHFCKSDDDRALHDHPWPSLSVLLKGSYVEYTEHEVETWHAPALIPRAATHTHRLELIDRQPVWTIFITGPKRREWGFWCAQGFVPWREFVTGPNGEPVGKGCGE